MEDEVFYQRERLDEVLEILNEVRGLAKIARVWSAVLRASGRGGFGAR